MQVVQIHGPGDVRLDRIEPPRPSVRDVVVRVEACGVCGTDLTFIRQGGSPRGSNPMALGHEAAGRIISIGDAVQGMELGQHVLINPMGSSAVIGNGGPEGAFTEELLVRDAAWGRTLLPVPEGLSSEHAALAEPLGVALRGVKRSGAKPGDKVAVFGCGPIGLGVVLWLKQRGIEDVVAIDVFDERLHRALGMGAKAVIRADRDDVALCLQALHGRAEVMGAVAAGTQVYIDAAGAPNIVPDVLKMARTHARLVILAAYFKPVELDLSAMLLSELSICTSMGYPDDELRDVLDLLPSVQGALEQLITHRVPFSNIIDAFAIAGRPESAKVMIHFP